MGVGVPQSPLPSRQRLSPGEDDTSRTDAAWLDLRRRLWVGSAQLRPVGSNWANNTEEFRLHTQGWLGINQIFIRCFNHC